jgi:putative transposase
MSDFNPYFHNRHSMRLKGFDYSQSGLYFVTICLQNHDRLFGSIANGEMRMNMAGEMIEKWLTELENKFPDIQCHERVIMPDHIHIIIEIKNDHSLDGMMNHQPGEMMNHSPGEMVNHHQGEMMNHSPGAHVGAPLRGRPVHEQYHPDPQKYRPDNQKFGPDNKKYNVKLGAIIDWFKTMTTNEYIRGVKNFGWRRFDQKLWQRNYWDHIIRDDQSLNRIVEYIEENPQPWDEDPWINDCR